MSRFFVCLGRFALMVAGFACAMLAASLFFNLLLIGMLGLAEASEQFLSGPVYVSVAFLAAVFGYHAFLPAMIALVAVELLGIRDWLSYALGGGAVGVAGAVLGEGATGPGIGLVFAACGLAGGLAYWAVAGRSAGLWLRDGAAARDR